MRYDKVLLGVIAISSASISSQEVPPFAQYSMISGHTYDIEEVEVLNKDNIVVTEDFQFFDLTHTYDVDIDMVKEVQMQDELSYTFSASNQVGVNALNTAIVDLSKRYVSLIEGEPSANDPLWPLAISNVEYTYANNHIPDDLIVGWPVDLDEFTDNPNYLYDITWRNVQELGTNFVLKRSGGAIGVFQLERGFGGWASPIIPEEFGGESRKDCWLTLGEVPDDGASIAWKLGLQADRWNYSDALNIIAGVVNQDIETQKTILKFNTFSDDKYGRVTLLMWGHNVGGGAYRDEHRASEVSRIINYIDELRELILLEKPMRFNGQTYFKDFISSRGLSYYPTAALASYLILEYRTQGAW